MIHCKKVCRWVAAAVLLGLALAGSAADKGLTLMHVHGLAFSPDGKRLLIPSHHGLAIYSDGRWTKASGPEHDYMGFSVTRGAFYSSGHPAPGSTLRNPFGLLRSKDGGRSWEQLGLVGEADFHILAANYAATAIYVFCDEPNSRMREPGIYSSTDEGRTWRRAKGGKLSGRIAALAVHPNRGNVLAAATDAGAFLSEDQGDNFSSVSGRQAVSVTFDLDGEHLWISGYDGRATLARMNLGTRKLEAVTIPAMTRDAVAYIAQNPAKRSQYAIATLSRDVHVSDDGAMNWKQIAAKGATR